MNKDESDVVDVVDVGVVILSQPLDVGLYKNLPFLVVLLLEEVLDDTVCSHTSYICCEEVDLHDDKYLFD